MTIDVLTQHWALVAASVMGTAILLFVLYRAWADSSGGRLRSRVKVLREREKAAAKAAERLETAVARLECLQAKADSVKPRLVHEAEEAIEDAKAAKKIADDLVLVARNDVRLIIVEEVPPRRQEAMRRKYVE